MVFCFRPMGPRVGSLTGSSTGGHGSGWRGSPLSNDWSSKNPEYECNGPVLSVPGSCAYVTMYLAGSCHLLVARIAAVGLTKTRVGDSPRTDLQHSALPMAMLASGGMRTRNEALEGAGDMGYKIMDPRAYRTDLLPAIKAQVCTDCART